MKLGLRNKGGKPALTGQAVSKMFENNVHIYVYSPGAGADNTLRSFFFFQKQIFCQFGHMLQVFSKFNDFVSVSHRRPNLTWL